MWQPRARARGFNPKKIVDAKKRGKYTEFFIEVTPAKLKGTTVGDAENCVGAKCVREATNATWVWMGTTVAIVGYENGQLVRYAHNGEVPKKHDAGFFPVGRYKFRAPSLSNSYGARNLRRHAGQQLGGADKVGDGSRKKKAREWSMAAQMRH